MKKKTLILNEKIATGFMWDESEFFYTLYAII